ncbi:hypothetical protein FB459_1273 [Yimella lutea]|uniref:Uncharacterized protein n=1 Tax=Yimella lutea TaxID=587872 RepID=A0A542EES9_9MICO|nr:hypothetical protein [Yimella lutea]TQJ13838.1 hypothetical protein FB459_1273 [Yimella lutea]
MNALDALHIGTLLVVTADAYIVGRVIERTRQQRRDAQLRAVVDDLRLFTTRSATPPEMVPASDRRMA